jgi:hypothetical protein
MEERPIAIETFFTGLNISSNRIKKVSTNSEEFDAVLRVQ